MKPEYEAHEKYPSKNEPALSDRLLELRFAREKNAEFRGFFRHEAPSFSRMSKGRLTLFARWVFVEKFHSNFQVRQAARRIEIPQWQAGARH